MFQLLTELTSLQMEAYGMITSQAMPWLDKRKKKDNTVNPIFQQAAELTDDLFWKQTLFKASQGKFPANFSYKGGLLIYKKGNKQIKVSLSDNPAEVLTVSLDFFREQGGIRSSLDTERERRISEPVQPFHEMEWKDTAKKNLRTLLLLAYVRDKVKEISPDKRKACRDHLLTLVNIGISLGHITDDHIHMEGGKIRDISSIYWDGHRFQLQLSNRKRRRVTTKDKPKTKKLNYLASWQKFLDSLVRGAAYSFSMAPEDSEE